jgi:hypothetical protein
MSNWILSQQEIINLSNVIADAAAKGYKVVRIFDGGSLWGEMENANGQVGGIIQLALNRVPDPPAPEQSPEPQPDLSQPDISGDEKHT